MIWYPIDTALVCCHDTMSINYQIKRLWASSVPILTANILESGIIDKNFNKKLTDAAISSFNNYSNTSSTSNKSPLENIRHQTHNEHHTSNKIK